MPHVLVLATGGTIASMPQGDGTVRAVIGAEDLVGRVRTEKRVSVTAKNIFTVGSYAFTFADLQEIGAAVIGAVDDPAVDGIVVTQGTDTLEEVAFFLDLVMDRRKPIALTGAQRDASHPQSDGPQNMADAIAVASLPAAASLGPVVVFNGHAFAAREVRKIDTCALNAFDAPGWGPVAHIDQGRVLVGRAVRRRRPLPLAAPVPIPLVRLAVGMTGDELRPQISGYPGVVLQAMGRGNAPPGVAALVQTCVNAGAPVVVTSRCLQGAVAAVYGNGGGKDLEQAGAWFAGDLAGEKARLLLGLLCAHEMTGARAKDCIDDWGVP